MSTAYRIHDEPHPGALADMTVNPVWPLFGVMFGGAGLSWPWFVVNGFAVGSPSRFRELGLALGGFAGSAVLIVAIDWMARAEVLSTSTVPYALLVLTVWKLFVTYWLYLMQGRSFHLYEHFGGVVKSGFAIVAIGYLLGRQVLPSLPVFWLLLLR